MTRQRLGVYNNDWFDRGRPVWIEALWLLASFFVASSIPGNSPRIMLLRLFGADISEGVVIKPGVRVKFPWRLSIGSNSWLGESAWIDNLGDVHIGEDVCVSQGAYICTGNHNWSEEGFDLKVEPVVLKDGSWVGAFARIAPGTTIEEDSVVSLGAVVVSDVPAGVVVSGNPATIVRERG